MRDSDVTSQKQKQKQKQKQEEPLLSRSTKARDEAEQAFEQGFWPAYPVRSGSRSRAEARKRFTTCVTKDKIPAGTLIDAAWRAC